MSIGQYLLGGAAGLVFGLLVAAGNTLLTRRSLQRAKQSQATVMGTSGLRQVINLAALVLVYLLRKVVPLPLAGTLIGTAVGLSGGSIAGVWILARKMDDTIPAEQRGYHNCSPLHARKLLIHNLRGKRERCTGKHNVCAEERARRGFGRQQHDTGAGKSR